MRAGSTVPGSLAEGFRKARNLISSTLRSCGRKFCVLYVKRPCRRRRKHRSAAWIPSPHFTPAFFPVPRKRSGTGFSKTTFSRACCRRKNRFNEKAAGTAKNPGRPSPESRFQKAPTVWVGSAGPGKLRGRKGICGAGRIFPVQRNKLFCMVRACPAAFDGTFRKALSHG